MSKLPTLKDLLNEENEIIERYMTGLNFIDEPLGGGFEMGQLVAVMGDAEAGKTQLINQILSNVGRGHKCLYFALEFNKRKIKRYFNKKLREKTISQEALNNIYIVTQDTMETEINNIAELIRLSTYIGIKFIAIDSSMMLYDNNLIGEAETTEIFRKLHELANKLDILILLITQMSKEDNKAKRASIFGSQKAAHFCDIIFYIAINRDTDTNEIINREFIIQKNKQTGNYTKRKLGFDKEKLEFYEINSNNTNNTNNMDTKKSNDKGVKKNLLRGLKDD